jgi:2-haloacid dehalogenase
MLVASHADDLTHANAAGLRTAYIARPLEHGTPPRENDPFTGGPFTPNLRAHDLNDLANQLGA